MFDDLNRRTVFADDGTPPVWERRRVKTLLHEVDRRSATGSERLLSLRAKAGLVDHLDSGGKPTDSAALVGFKLVRPGELVMNRMRAATGVFAIASRNGLVSPDYALFVIHPEVDPFYLLALLRIPAMADEMRLRSRGMGTGESGFLRLYSDAFGAMHLVLPPPDEQAAIVKYLAHAHQVINEALVAKRRLLAFLEEEERAVLDDAILTTQRTTSNRVPLKKVVAFQEGPGIMAADFRDQGVPLLRIASMAAEQVDLTGCNYLDPEMVERRWAHFKVRSGDYLLSASGSTGIVKPVGSEAIGAIPYTGLIRLWPQTDDVDMEFVRHYMRSSDFAAQINMYKTGVGIEHFGPTHLKRMHVQLPTLDEQRTTVARIDTEFADIGSRRDRTHREIGLIEEFRTRLTADVVTGQVDVRGIAAALPKIDPKDAFPAGLGSADEDGEDDAVDDEQGDS